MCSLEEAFTTFQEVDSRNTDYDQEKKKKKKRRAALPPPEPLVVEPDRPAHRPLGTGELLTGPSTNRESTSVSEMLNAYEQASYFPHPHADKEDENVYKLEPDWAKAFHNDSAPDWIKQRMPQRDAEVPLVPSPWMDGASTLWRKVPESQKLQSDLEGASNAANEKIDELQRKLDKMFKKLDDLEVSRNESNHVEIILFVLGGIFLILMLDLLVKQGTQATMILAAAGGGMLQSNRFAKTLFF